MTGAYRTEFSIRVRRGMLVFLLAGLLIAAMPQALATTFYYGYAGTREQLVDYLSEQVALQAEEINFEFAEELYDTISDDEAMLAVLNEAGILGANWSYNKVVCTVSNLTLLPAHVMCETEDDIYQALYCAITGSVNIRLTPELYEMVCANEFEELHVIEGRAGLLKREMTYYNNSRLIEYTNMELAQNFNAAESIEEVKKILLDRTNALTESFSFHCPPELFDRIREDDFRWLDALESNCGILQRDMTYYTGKKIITYTNVVYYPGVRIVKAVQNGWMHILSDEEKNLFDTADSIVKAALARYESDLRLEIDLHDAVLDRTVYELNASGEVTMAVDTAYGALIEGRADCEGYSDAFYLLGNLAGLNVRIQHGESLSDNTDIGHLWNLIEINGQWYIVDTTWDDSENGRYYSHMNLGRELAQMEYVWDETAALETLAPTTDPYNYYYVINGIFFDSMSTALNYINHALDSGENNLTVMINNTTGKDKETFLDELYGRIMYSGDALSKQLFGNVIAINISIDG